MKEYIEELARLCSALKPLEIDKWWNEPLLIVHNPLTPEERAKFQNAMESALMSGSRTARTIVPWPIDAAQVFEIPTAPQVWINEESEISPEAYEAVRKRIGAAKGVFISSTYTPGITDGDVERYLEGIKQGETFEERKARINRFRGGG